MKKTHSFTYTLKNDWSELSELDQDMIVQAFEACENAYAPYSQFKVGASVLLKNGQVVLGSNQENIAYPSGLCAERVALFAVGANYPKESIATIYIVAKGDLLPFEKILAPCGGCRQVMVESEIRQNEPYRVVLVSQNRKTLIFNAAKDLLPFSFGSD
jgi:cytidine deaminase